MSDRLTEIRARVARRDYFNKPLSATPDLEFCLAEIERLKVHYKGIPHDWVALQLHEGVLAERDALRAALKGISKLGNLTLLGGSAMDSERAYEAGAHEAFSQAADIARSALGADYVQEG